MNLLARLFLTFVFLLITYHLSFITSVAQAEGEFQTDYKVSYTVEPSGRTNVTQDIVLKNKTANFYADKFELKIGSTKVENVKAGDSVGPLETQVKFENNVTSISVKFNQRVIGIDKTLPWTLSYSSGELASKSGQIWEISIPKVGDSQDIGTYDATISVPTGFGPAAFTVPTPKTSSTQKSQQFFTFDKDQLTKSGIAMSFGEKQVFSFELNYFLENRNLTAQIQEITLPPDNNYQKVVIEKIDPPPQDVTIDADGNFLAKYRLLPKQKLDVSVGGYAEVFSKPFRNIYSQLSQTEIERYTQPQRYWETDNGWIGDKANELKTPEKIYDFVTNYLSYSQERLNSQNLERKGAAQAVSLPQDSVCMEFTDLFIALSRAAKIPAREVEGFAYTQNERLRPLSLALAKGDVLHAWPEYWDENLGWVQVDPTWANTSGGLDYFNKLDFNHITFVQRGLSSTYPYPAGAYKREENLGQKAVFVSFAQELPKPTEAAELELFVPDKIIAGIPVRISAQVKNVGSTSILGKIDLTTNLKVANQSSQNLGVLPPYSKREVQFRLQTKDFFTRSTEPISVSFGDKFATKSVSVIPIYFLLVSPNFLIGVATSVLIIIFGFYLFRRFHKRSLRLKI